MLGFWVASKIVELFTPQKLLKRNTNQLRRNPPEVRVTSGQKSSTKIIYIVLQTSVGLF